MFKQLLLLSALPALALSQTPDRTITTNSNAWLMYFGDHPVANSKWGAHIEGQWRRHDFVDEGQQSMFRPGVNYQISENVMLTAGYMYAMAHRYGEFPAAVPHPEHRYWQQVQLTQQAGRVKLTHRYRLEQRLIGEGVVLPDGSRQIENYRHENRARYMFRVQIPIRGRWGMAFYDEVMVNFGENVASNVFDQNRIYGVATYDVGLKSRLEVGYLNQFIQQRNGRIFESNHTLQVAIFSTLPFGGRGN